jgi:proteasome lid subunit RPN8/RPN11
MAVNSDKDGVTAGLYRAIVEIVDDRVKEIRVTREDFSELKGAINELADAQTRAEERMGQLEDAVEKLALAQAKTEERVGRLEDAVEKLALAQARTEETVERLVKAQRELSVEVGKLSTAIGFDIEDVGRVVLPGYLERHFGIEVEELERKFFSVDGEEVEMNFYGDGVKKGERIVILGEAKSRIYGGEVKDFVKAVAKLKIKDKVFKVMFSFFIHPSASELAGKEGIALVASYQR